MQTNMKYMMQSFKSTIFTILPVILIFSWMNANFAFEPVMPGEQFEIALNFDQGSGEVVIETPQGIQVIGDTAQDIKDRTVFVLEGQKGMYTEDQAIQFTYGRSTAYKEVIITDQQRYTPKVKSDVQNPLESIEIDYQKKHILPILGWGWLGTYIIFSIIFSMLLRKLMRVY